MILTVARDEALRQRVSSALSGTEWAGPVTEVAGVGEALQLLEGPNPPRVVIVGRSIGVDGATDLAASGASRSVTVLVVADPTTEVLRTAMRAGIRDVLPPDFVGEDLVRALRDAGVSSGGPDVLPGVTVSVFSTKGGVGTSVVAANLATRLGQRTDGGTTLVDLDLASADQAIMHGLSAQWTIQHLADGAVGLDAESLAQVLVPIPGSPTRLLAGPVDPALAETITAAQVAAIVPAVRALSSVAVLDTASGFDDRTLAALDASDMIVVVSSLDVAALRSLTVSLQTMARLGIPEDAILVTVVRADSKSGLLVSDVEHAISRPVDVGVPSTRRVPRSVNEGVPLAISAPRSDVVQAIDEIADRVLERAPASLPSPSTTEASRGGGLLPWSRRDREDTPDDRPAQEEPVIADAGGTSTGPAVTSESESTPAGDVEPPEDSVVTELGADVRSITEASGRAERAPAARPRSVRRRPVPAPDDDAVDLGAAATDDGTGSPPVRAVGASLEEMPPPKLVDDDADDDRPRRRRRR